MGMVPATTEGNGQRNQPSPDKRSSDLADMRRIHSPGDGLTQPLLFIRKIFHSEKLPCIPRAAPAHCRGILGGNRQRRENRSQEHLSLSPKPTITAPVPGNLSREAPRPGEQQGKHCKGLATFSF